MFVSTFLIHENGWASDECGEWVEMAMTKNKDDCARQAREAGLPGFAFGPDEAFGECSGETILVTQAYSNKYVHDQKRHPHAKKASGCPPKCAWEFNPYFNSYAINPSSMGKAFQFDVVIWAACIISSSCNEM